MREGRRRPAVHHVCRRGAVCDQSAGPVLSGPLDRALHSGETVKDRQLSLLYYRLVFLRMTNCLVDISVGLSSVHLCEAELCLSSNAASFLVKS